MTEITRIRNFSIIAHIDHGKSTIADRIIHKCGGLSEREMKAQVLDSMEIERERGITIKAQTVKLNFKAKNGKEYILNKNDPLLFFIQRLRDEAHRFAISTHRAKRKKNLSKSLLDQIQGIGKQRKRALLNHFGSARAVESASLDEIKTVEGVEEKVAKKIYNFFHE